MGRVARVVVPGYPHHVTQRGVRSMRIFRHDGDKRMYLRFLAEEKERFGTEILAWCLMSNHVHLVAVPREERALARTVGDAHKKYTWMRNFREGTRGYLFQGRFHSCVLDERHLLAAVRYVECNPVRAGVAKNAWEYPWSSARFHLRRRKRDILVHDRNLYGLIDNWEEYLSGEDSEAERKLRAATRTGRPAGDKGIVALVRQLTGRDLTKQKPGPHARNMGRKSALELSDVSP